MPESNIPQDLSFPTCPQVVHELMERFDAHLKAEQFYSVIANMRANSPEEAAALLLNAPGLTGLQVRCCTREALYSTPW